MSDDASRDDLTMPNAPTVLGVTRVVEAPELWAVVEVDKDGQQLGVDIRPNERFARNALREYMRTGESLYQTGFGFMLRAPDSQLRLAVFRGEWVESIKAEQDRRRIGALAAEDRLRLCMNCEIRTTSLAACAECIGEPSQALDPEVSALAVGAVHGGAVCRGMRAITKKPGG